MGLKGLFIKEDIAPVQKVVPTQTPFTTTTSFYVAPIPGSFTSAIDPDVKSALLQSLQDNKLAGFDYLKFVASLEQMKSVAPSEEARFKMTFIAAQQLGVDKAKLVDSANHYLDVLKQDLTDYTSDLKVKQTEEVGNNEARLNEITKTITQLQSQLTQLQSEAQNLTSKISENKVKLENKKSIFEATHSSVVNEINDNIRKINQYL